MNPIRDDAGSGWVRQGGFVSERFLSDFFSALGRQGIQAGDLLGDLPIALDEAGIVRSPVEWAHFADFMRRLENRLGGPGALELCGESIGELKPAAALRALAGAASSAHALYFAAVKWALRRALPGIEVRLDRLDDGHLEIHARLAPGLRPCPQIFHFAVGGARALPGVIGLENAVVSATVHDCEAHYRIALPPSRSLLARLRRAWRAVFSAGSVVRFLETQQLELHAQNEALRRAHDALAESELRYRTMTDAAVDLLCEIDERGQLVYVSASVEDLIGYTPTQVTNSHYRLWVARSHHAEVDAIIDRLFQLPTGASTITVLPLHTESGEAIDVEATARTYATSDGSRRLMCILRDLRGSLQRGEASPASGVAEDLRERLEGHLRPPDATEGPDAQVDCSVEQSLAQLLARLDEAARGHALVPEAVRNEAARRITRVVDAAVSEANATATRFQWIETRKLMHAVREHFRQRATAAEIELQVDLTRAPSEIWADHDLLETALASLVDWAAADAPNRSAETPDRLEIVVEARAPENEPRTVRFSLIPLQTPPRRAPAGKSARSESAALYLAIASDAVEALGGRSGAPAAPDFARWIELIQPARGAEPTEAYPSADPPAQSAGPDGSTRSD